MMMIFRPLLFIKLHLELIIQVVWQCHCTVMLFTSFTLFLFYMNLILIYLCLAFTCTAVDGRKISERDIYMLCM